MIANFDIENLKAFLKDFYTAVGIRISVFNDEFELVTEYPETAPEICKLIRQSKEGANACKQCDYNACLNAKKLSKQHLYLCHAGITEAVTPIKYDGVVLGYVILAHMMPVENYNEAISKAVKLISKYNVDKNIAEALLKKINPKSIEEINASVNLCNAIASYIYVSNLVKFKDEDTSLKITQFINNNIAFDLSSATICKQFLISRTKLYELSINSFGMGISQYVTALKIKKAKELLKLDYSVNKVAEAVGFLESNYFTKVFKKTTGLTPTEYKNEIKK